jgi:predicted AAA+ superfamily ATPase
MTDIYEYLPYSSVILLFLLQCGFGKMNKPEKIYLNNPNMVHSLTDTPSNQGTLRETFFVNQLQVFHKINGSDKGDFRVNDKYTFEIGGKNKKQKQITGINNAFIAADHIEYAHENKIPLWLFGFLY